MKTKRLKKVICLMLTVAVTLGMSIIAVASGDSSTTATLTIQSADAGREFDLYQIFAGDVSTDNGEKIITVRDWGSAIKGTKSDGTEYDYSKNLIRALKNSLSTHFTSITEDSSARDVAAIFATDTFDTATNADALANVIGGVLDTCQSPKVDTGKVEGTLSGQIYNYEFEDLDPGYYMIDENVDPSDPDIETYTRWMMKILGSQVVSTKSTARPKIEKMVTKRTTVQDDALNTKYTGYTDAAIGETLDFEIDSSIPDMEGYRHYQYVILDTMSKGLEYVDGSIKVELDGKEIDNPDAYTVTFTEGENYDTDGSHVLKIVFKNFLENYQFAKGYSLAIKYQAKLTDDAYVGTNQEENCAKLIYSNNPTQTYENDPDDPFDPTPINPNYTPVIGITPEQSVYMYSTTIAIHKKDANGRALSGAEFKLTSQDGNTDVLSKVRIDEVTSFEEDANGTFYKLKAGTYTTVAPASNGSTNSLYESTTTKYKRVVTTTKVLVNEGNGEIIGTVDDSGYLYFRGLAEGHYTLTETEAPAGYNEIEPIDFTIEMGGSNRTNISWGVTKTTSSEYVTMDVSSDKTTILVEVINTKGSQLPETGGAGTRMFYIIGGIMVIVALVLLITKKRMSAAAKRNSMR